MGSWSDAVLNAKVLKDCTGKEVDEVRRLARIHASRNKRPQLADDFASFVMEDLVKRGAMIYNMHWLWCHFLRLELGNMSNKKGKAKLRGGFLPMQIEEARHVSDKSAESPEDRIAFQERVRRMEIQRRVTTVLYFKWGFTFAEIGDVLGVSGERAAQLFREIKEKGDRVR